MRPRVQSRHRMTVIGGLTNGWLGAAILCVFGASAWAAEPTENTDFQNCLLQHHYMQVPLKDAGPNVQKVEATINGKRIAMVVDTGCDSTCITYPLARHLRLNIADTGHPAIGMGGPTEGNVGKAPIGSFIMGGCEINRMSTIGVMPRGNPAPVRSCSGLLGLDYLRLNAALILVGSKGLILKPGGTPVAAISKYLSNLGFKAVPMTFKFGKMFVEGHLSGHPFRAFIDTGCSFTMLNSALVRSALGRTPFYTNIQTQTADGRQLRVGGFSSNTMDIGGFKLPPTMATTLPTVSSKKYPVDGIIGSDLLAQHAAVLDLGSDTLWMR